MQNRQGEHSHPPGSSTVSTTTTHGPFTTTTTSHTTAGQGTSVIHYGPQSVTVTAPTVTTRTQAPAPRPQAPAPPALQLHSSSIRIRRPSVQQPTQTAQSLRPNADAEWQGNRRRSSSEPRAPPAALLHQDDGLQRHVTATPTLQPLYEEGSRAEQFTPDDGQRLAPSDGQHLAPSDRPPSSRRPNVMRNPLARQPSAINIRRKDADHEQYNMRPSIVDVLDVIDPEISALTTLNNVQNSLFLPNLPWLYNRAPTYELGPSSSSDSSDEEMGGARAEDRLQDTSRPSEAEQAERAERAPLARMHTIDSILSTMDEGPDHHYAVLPHGASLSGWTDEEKAALDDHVRHLLHSRRAKFKRTMRGFGRYMRNPLGFIVTLYFFLITFWGAAWVLFLIGWIYVGNRQDYFVEIADQVLTALFCVVGITMFPFRIVDTYHMIFVATYAHKTWRLRKERGLAELKDHNELPNLPPSSAWESGDAEVTGMETTVLTAEEQKKLEHHQGKLAKSHTFYRPRETYTHNAFSIKLLITIVVLLDCHSMLQCALGATTWGIYYKHRPKALTAVILSFSLTCNITAGILISRGDKKSRKKLVVEQLMRQEMTEEALRKLREERGIKAKGLMTKKQKKQVRKELGETKKSPLDTILHRG